MSSGLKPKLLDKIRERFVVLFSYHDAIMYFHDFDVEDVTDLTKEGEFRVHAFEVIA